MSEIVTPASSSLQRRQLIKPEFRRRLFQELCSLVPGTLAIFEFGWIGIVGLTAWFSIGDRELNARQERNVVLAVFAVPVAGLLIGIWHLFWLGRARYIPRAISLIGTVGCAVWVYLLIRAL